MSKIIKIIGSVKYKKRLASANRFLYSWGLSYTQKSFQRRKNSTPIGDTRPKPDFIKSLCLIFPIIPYKYNIFLAATQAKK